MSNLHSCARFWALALECPFRRFRDHEEDDPPDEEFEQFVVGERKAKDADQELRNVTQLIPHGDPVVRKLLERMAAIKDFGGLPSIPDSIPALPFGGRGHPEIIAVLTAIAIMSLLKGMRSLGPNPSLRAVTHAETQSGKGLKGVSKTLSARTQGRGGFQVNAAADLRRLLFGRRKQRRKKDGGAALTGGFDEFSETGFF